MGRALGSKNGQGSSSRQTLSSRQFLNGRKTPSTSSHEGSGLGQTNGCCSEPVTDRSQTNFPFDIRISGFSSLMNTVRRSTPKVQKLILDECDIILECRVCRNLFRSLPNFLTHKQSFCKKQFHPAADSGFSQFLQTSNNSYEFQYHLDQSLLEALPITPISDSARKSFESNSTANLNAFNEENYSSNIKDATKREKMSRLHSVLSRVAPAIENATRSPSSLYSDIIVRRNILTNGSKNGQGSELAGTTIEDNKFHLLIEPLGQSTFGNSPKNGIVFQKAIGYDPSSCDVSGPQADPRIIAHPDSAVLGPDGKVLCVGNADAVERIVDKVVAQVEELHDEQRRRQTELNCSECLTLFPTRKALRIHVRAVHRHGPDLEEEQNSCDNKIPSDFSLEACEDVALNTSDTERKISPPPSKKIKPGNLLEVNGGSPYLPQKSISEDHLQTCAVIPLAKSSPPEAREVLLPTGKRPRGRPRKNSVNNNNYNKDSFPLSTSLDSSSYTKDLVTNISQLTNVNTPTRPILTCGKCSAKFGTKSDMSMHLAHCTGVINYAFLQCPKSPENNNRISIQIRRDYVKESPATSESIGTGNGHLSENSSTFTSSLSSTSNFGWSRNPAPSRTVNPSNIHKVKNNSNSSNSSVSSQSLTLEECVEIAKYKIYSTSPDSSNRNVYSNGNNNNKPLKYNNSSPSVDEQDDIEDDDDEEEDNDVASVRGRNSSSNNSSDDDGLPDDDEKNSNHEVELDAETDRDSNVTDSGVSTTSVILKHYPNSLPVQDDVRKNSIQLPQSMNNDISSSNVPGNVNGSSPVVKQNRRPGRYFHPKTN